MSAKVSETDDESGAKVFLSYSRKDREQAQRIADVLRERDFGVFRDTDDILPTEEWRDRLQQLIEEADTIVFLMSPHSIASEVCAWEVELAASLNKRIAPIVIDDVEGAEIPPLLAKLNFIFCTPRDPFDNAVATLVSALETDVEWIREHTRIAALARRWDKAARPSRLLLRGQDIADAEAWRDNRPDEAPAVTTEQGAFIATSRRAAAARQRGWIAGSLIVTAASAALAVFAYFQSVEADRQRDVAQTQRAEAEAQRVEAEAQRAEAEQQKRAAQTTQSLFLADQARRELIDGRAANAVALAWEALPHDAELAERPITPEALHALRQSLMERREIMAIRPETANLIHIAPDTTAHRAFAIVDKRIEMWDLLSETRAPFPPNATGPGAVDVGRIAVSEDGRRLLARAYDPPRLLSFDLTDNSYLGETPIADGHVIQVFAPTPGGAIVVYNRGLVHRIRPNGEVQVTDLKADLLWDRAVDATANGAQLAIGDFDGQMYFIDYAADTLVTPPKADLPISALALGEGGAVAAYTSGGNAVTFVRPDTGDAIVEIEPRAPVNVIDFDAATSTIWFGHEDGSLSQWSTELEEIAAFGAHEQQISGLHVGASGSWIMTTGLENTARVWRAWRDMSAAAWRTPEGYYSETALTSDGAVIRAEWPKTGPVTIIPETGARVEAPAAPGLKVYDVAFSPAGDRFLTTDEAGRISEWSVQDGTLLRQVDLGEKSLHADYTPDGAGALALTKDSETIVHISLPDGVRTNVVSEAGQFMKASASRKGDVIVGDDTEGAFAFHRDTGRRVAAPGGASLGAVHPDGRLAAGFIDEGVNARRIVIWRTDDGAVEHSLPGLDHTVYGMTFSNDGEWLGAMTGDGAYLWRTDGSAKPQRFNFGASSLGIAFSGDGSVFGANSDEGVARLWRTSDGAQIARLDPQGEPGTAVALHLSETGERAVVTTYRDDTTRLWLIERDAARLIEQGRRVVETLAPLSFARRCAFFLETGPDCRSVTQTPR